VCRRRKFDKRRLGDVIVVSRAANKTNGIVAVATVVSRNRGHLFLALVPDLKHGAIVEDVPELVAVVALDIEKVTTAALTSIAGADEGHVGNALGRRLLFRLTPFLLKQAALDQVEAQVVLALGV